MMDGDCFDIEKTSINEDFSLILLQVQDTETQFGNIEEQHKDSNYLFEALLLVIG